MHARGKAVDPDINWKELSRAMAGFTGADCMGLMQRAARMAGRQVSREAHQSPGRTQGRRETNVTGADRTARTLLLARRPARRTSDAELVKSKQIQTPRQGRQADKGVRQTSRSGRQTNGSDRQADLSSGATSTF